MPRIENPLELLSYLEFGANRAPGAAPSGKARLWFDAANNLLKLSLNGVDYSQLPVLSSSEVLANSVLAPPKIETYQETVAFGAFTDGGSTAGTLALSTSIPAGAVFLRSLVHGLTGFAGDTSATLTIGDGTDVDRYNTGTPDMFTTAAAGVDVGAPSGTLFHSAAKTPTLTITSASDWGLVTAGALTVTLFWYAPN
jgi:hypothetical protein